MSRPNLVALGLGLRLDAPNALYDINELLEYGGLTIHYGPGERVTLSFIISERMHRGGKTGAHLVLIRNYGNLELGAWHRSHMRFDHPDPSYGSQRVLEWREYLIDLCIEEYAAVGMANGANEP